ncbi:MAG: hypothetical protein RSA10_01870 [Bacilli bacterium]
MNNVDKIEQLKKENILDLTHDEIKLIDDKEKYEVYKTILSDAIWKIYTLVNCNEILTLLKMEKRVTPRVVINLYNSYNKEKEKSL